LEALINKAHKNLRAFAEGRTVFIGHILNFRNRAQHCLADIGEEAQKELHELATLDLSISEGLQRWYQKGVYNDFDVKEGDPSEFLRLQKEYDQAMPPKIERMIALLEQVREKMLGIALAAKVESLVRPFPTPEGTTWADVLVRFTGDFDAQISARDHTEVRTYVEMGFEDRRGKRSSKPDRNWVVLRDFAERDGAIQSTKEAAEWPKLEKAVQSINARLKEVFGMLDSPIRYDRASKSYRAKFKLIGPPGNENMGI
jgi:hypothetical protein